MKPVRLAIGVASAVAVVAFGAAVAQWRSTAGGPGCRAPFWVSSEPMLAFEGRGEVRGTWHLLAVEGRADDAVTFCLDGEVLPDLQPVFGEHKTLGIRGWVASLDLAPVSPGRHVVRAHVRAAAGSVRVAAARFLHEKGAHRVRFRVRQAGRPVAARIVVTDGVAPVVLGAPLGRKRRDDRDGKTRSVFASDGRAELFLDAGTYRFLGVRRLFDGLGSATVDVAGDTEVELEIPVALDTSGWRIADLHVHSARSQDSALPDRLRVRSLAAAGLDVAVITDHDRVGAVVGEAPGLQMIEGVEVDVFRPNSDVAHLNAFPVARDAVLPPSRSGSLAGAMHRYRGLDPHIFLQLNHPRGIHFVKRDRPSRGAWAAFNALGFDRALPPGEGENVWMTRAVGDPPTIPLDFDAVEVLNRFSVASWLEVREDWFSLLDHGVRWTATGNSDSHATERELAGMTVNLVRVQTDDTAALLASLRAGRVVVSTGPWVGLSVARGEERAQVGDTLTGGGAVTARIRVRAAPWVPVPEVRLVVGGDVVYREAVPREGGLLDLRVEVPLEVDRDTWVVAEAGWPAAAVDSQPRVDGDYGLVAPLFVPIGFTNPVFLDGDGDGAWQPEG